MAAKNSNGNKGKKSWSEDELNALVDDRIDVRNKLAARRWRTLGVKVLLVLGAMAIAAAGGLATELIKRLCGF